MNDQVRRAVKEALRHPGIQKFCVLWLEKGREHRSPWFYSSKRAEQAKEIMASKYGKAIVYRLNLLSVLAAAQPRRHASGRAKYLVNQR